MKGVDVSQYPIRVISTDNYSREIVVADLRGRRLHFAYGEEYEQVCREVNRSARQGWCNQAWAILCSSNPEEVIVREGTKASFGRKEREQVMDGDYRKEPNAEYRWTAIAARTVRDSLNYKERRWFKTKEEVQEFIGPIFEANKGSQVQLVIVEAVDLVKPKPSVETIVQELRK